MSDVNLDFTVNNNSVNFTVQPNDITFTPSDVQLTVFAGGVGLPGGSINQIQYNAGSVLAGTPNLVYNAGTGATIISNLVSTTKTNLGAVSTITITGGAANYALTTDGTGNLSWVQVSNVNYANFANIANTANSVAGANIVGTVANANYAAYAGNVTIAAQPNITSLGNLTNLVSTGNVIFTAAGNVRLGNVSNVKITGGTNGYVLQTDGTGNLTWTAQTGNGGGNGSPGGSNTQIQYNDAGSFGGNVGFTFNKTSGDVLLPNNLSVTNNITAGNVIAPVTLPYGIENLNLITAQTGTYNFDLISNAIRYTTTNSSANITINFRGNSTVSANSLLANGQSITGTYVFKTGATPYGITALQIDGSAQSIKWASNVIPLQVANTLTSYVFTIVKTSTTPTYDVLGSATRYG